MQRGDGAANAYPQLAYLLMSCVCADRDMFLMSRTKAHWRRLSVWVEAGKEASEGWAYLQSWDNPPATIGTMAAMTALCCYPHITISLGATALVIYMVRCPRCYLQENENKCWTDTCSVLFLDATKE